MCSERRFGRSTWRFFDRSLRRQGMLLMELLIAAGILALAAGIAIPVLTSWQAERLLDGAVAETVAVIRQVQHEARNDERRAASAPQGRKRLIFTMQNGRARYYSSRGIYSMAPKGYLPEGSIVSPSTVELEFRRDGFSGGNGDYAFHVMTKDRKHARKVVLAMYTGRVRVEEAW